MKNAVVFKIPGNIEMEYKDNADKNFDIMFDNMRDAVKNRSVDILHNGPFDLERDRAKFATTKRLATYAFFEFRQEPLETGTDEFWEWMERFATITNWPELIEKTYSYQMISMQYYNPDYGDIQLFTSK